MASQTVALIVSLDTKAEEAAFLRDRLTAAGVGVTLVDFGSREPSLRPDVAAKTIASLGGADLADLRSSHDRNITIAVMMAGAAAWARDAFGSGEIGGILSVGGSGGTAVGTAAMRALPFGAPKLMVSTVAAADVRAYVGTSDVTMMNSVVDFAGINPISEPVLANAAAAMAGMMQTTAQPRRIMSQRLIAATQFGVTTPATETAKVLLADAGFTLVPFHATGIGGQTMEALIDDGLFEGVLDLTTTEWADEIVGGNLGAGPDRLGAAARAGIPQVVAPGALDMVNFFNVPVPDRFRSRRIHQHNAQVALMRTTPEENAEIARRIAEKLNAATGPVAVLFPGRGVSALDAEGQPFFDPAATAALRDAFEKHLEPQVRFKVLDHHINDPEFAASCVRTLVSLIDQQKARLHA